MKQTVLSIAFFLASFYLFARQQPPYFKEAPPFLKDASLKKEHIRFGWLVVPENRNNPVSTRTSLIAVAIIKSRTSAARHDPVVFLQGGPGGGAISGYKVWLNHPLRMERDIILIDQRGTGFSGPPLCPDMGAAFFSIMAKDLSIQQEISERVKAAAAGYARLQKSGADLSIYNSETTSYDLHDCKTVLNYADWNVYGLSYGTRVALEYMKRFPQDIRSMVLDSPVSPDCEYYNKNTDNYVRALNVFFNKCESDPLCRRRFGNIRDLYFNVLTALEKAPLVVPMSRSVLPTGVFILNKQDFQMLVQQALYKKMLVELLPWLMREIKHRNTEVLPPLITALSSKLNLDYGTYYTVLSGETLPFNSTEQLEQNASRFPEASEGLSFYRGDLAIGRFWKTNATGSLRDSAVTGNVPSVLLAGELDPITPPGNGVLVAGALQKAYFYAISNYGHAPGFSPCGKKIVASFIDHPQTRPDTSCLNEKWPLAFAVDIYINSGVSRFAAALGNMNVAFLAPAIASLLLLLFVLAISVIRYMKQRKSNAFLKNEKLVLLTAGLGALLGLLFFTVLVLAINAASRTNPYILAIGLPGHYRLMIILPILAILFAIILTVMVLIGHSRKLYPASSRLLYTAIVCFYWIVIGGAAAWIR